MTEERLLAPWPTIPNTPGATIAIPKDLSSDLLQPAAQAKPYERSVPRAVASTYPLKAHGDL